MHEVPWGKGVWAQREERVDAIPCWALVEWERKLCIGGAWPRSAKEMTLRMPTRQSARSGQ
jgi:hypothetical protein